MARSSPVVLILGHSFVRRLCHDLETGFDHRADLNLTLRVLLWFFCMAWEVGQCLNFACLICTWSNSCCYDIIVLFFASYTSRDTILCNPDLVVSRALLDDPRLKAC